MPSYFGGLLLGLAAMIGIFSAKKAFLPTFHPIEEKRPLAKIAPGGSVRIVYNKEPGHYLIYGMPTSLTVAHKQGEELESRLMSFSYRELTENSPVLGPFPMEGHYQIRGEFYVCAEPGVADCTKLLLSQEVQVDRNVKELESKLEIDLPHLASLGLSAASKNQKNP